MLRQYNIGLREKRYLEGAKCHLLYLVLLHFSVQQIHAEILLSEYDY